MMIPAYSHPCYLLESPSCLSSDDFPAPFFPFPSPNVDAEDPLPNHLPLEDSFGTCAIQDNEAAAKATKKQKTEVAPAKTYKRTLRTDRHSKIHTAQGLRHRRMRLSLDVARKFFGLQDLLGFDKASSTVDWLITQSKDAIEKHLMHFSKESSIVNSHSAPIAACSSSKRKLHPHKAKEKEPVQPSASRRGSFNQLLTRKSRVEARARARERTNEKKKKEILVEVESGEAAGQLQSIANLVYHTTEKEECSNLVEGIDYEYLPMYMAGQLSHHPNISYCNYSKDYSISSNEESVNFFHQYEQLNEKFSGELKEQQSSLLAEVQFQSCTVGNTNPII